MSYFIRRIGFFLVTLWGAVTLNFIIPRISGGDPATILAQKLAGKGQPVSPDLIKAINAMIGTPHTSLWNQYWQYLDNTIHGNFGVSISYYPYTVTHMISQGLFWTIILVGVTLVLSFLIGTLLGTWVAWRRGSNFDSIMTVSSTFVGTLPFFWVALLLIWVFSYTLGWFPSVGGYSGSIPISFSGPFIADAAHYFVLPALSLMITGPIGWMLGMRNNMVQSLGEDYARFGRAKGLSNRVLALNYGARVAILPSVTSLAMSLGGLLGGTVLVEQIFQYPGMGRLLFDAVNDHDYPLAQTIFLFVATGTLLANLAADMVYGILDPRARRKEAA